MRTIRFVRIPKLPYKLYELLLRRDKSGVTNYRKKNIYFQRDGIRQLSRTPSTRFENLRAFCRECA